MGGRRRSPGRGSGGRVERAARRSTPSGCISHVAVCTGKPGADAEAAHWSGVQGPPSSQQGQWAETGADSADAEACAGQGDSSLAICVTLATFGSAGAANNADGQGPATSPRTSSTRPIRFRQPVVFIASSRHRLPGLRKVPPSRLNRPGDRPAGSAPDRNDAPGPRHGSPGPGSRHASG